MESKKDDKSYLLPLLLLLLSGFFLYLFLMPEKKSATVTAATPSAHSKAYEDKVNRYLFQTSQRIELEREKAQLEASKLSDQDLHPARPEDRTTALDFSADPRQEALLKDLGREARNPDDPSNPQEEIQAELFQEQQDQAYSEEYKTEYARQFVENARKAGYEVKLSSDFKVLSVKPLRRPADNYQLFQNLGGGVR